MNHLRHIRKSWSEKMSEYKQYTDDELEFAQLKKQLGANVVQRDNARIDQAGIKLAIKNLNTLIIDMEVDIQKLEEKGVKPVVLDKPNNGRLDSPNPSG